jgi:arabinose-5-phosphate isomerase
MAATLTPRKKMSEPVSKDRILTEARRVFEIEARAVLDLKDRINGDFAKAVEILGGCKGKIIVTGMGKSGQIGRKLASTLSSTGSPSVFVHPAESSHGDMGVLSPQDVVLALSYRGETPEMNHLINFALRKGLKIVSMTGHPDSSLGQSSDVVLDVSVKQEACPLGLAPTASTTASLAMGDALAMALIVSRGFRAEDFAEFHPGGSLGRRLLTRVKDLMHTGEALPLVQETTPMKEVIYKMTSKEVRGAAGVLDANGKLMGVVTDGNLRRRLEKGGNPLDDKAIDMMSRNPKTIDQNEMAERALFVMEQFAIQVLFAVDQETGKPVGILHLQDLLKANIR